MGVICRYHFNWFRAIYHNIEWHLVPHLPASPSDHTLGHQDSTGYQQLLTPAEQIAVCPYPASVVFTGSDLCEETSYIVIYRAPAKYCLIHSNSTSESQSWCELNEYDLFIPYYEIANRSQKWPSCEYHGAKCSIEIFFKLTSSGGFDFPSSSSLPQHLAMPPISDPCLTSRTQMWPEPNHCAL